MNLTQFLISTVLVGLTPGVCQIMLLNQVVLHGRRGGLYALAGTATACLIWSAAAAGGLTALLSTTPAAMTAVRWGGGLFLVVLGIRSILTLRHPTEATPAATPGAHEALGADGTTLPDVLTVEDILTTPQTQTEKVAVAVGDAGTTDVTPRPTLGGSGVDTDTTPTATPGTGGDFRVGVLTNLANPQIGVFMLAFLPQFVPAGGDALTWMGLLGILWTVVVCTVLLGLVFLVDQARSLLESPRANLVIGMASGVVLVLLGIGTILSGV